MAPTLAGADQAQYIYDDLGRLSQVIDGSGNVATYTYNAVGNLLSITCNTGNAGTSVSISITGANLTGAALAGLLKTLEERLPAWKNADSYSPSDRAG